MREEEEYQNPFWRALREWSLDATEARKHLHAQAWGALPFLFLSFLSSVTGALYEKKGEGDPRWRLHSQNEG